jgi:hypothetical protein
MTGRPSAELQKVSEHVLYEVQMLFATATRLREHVKGVQRLPWELEMATIESFAMHTRVLIEFLWREPQPGQKRRHKEDAFAADFMPPDEWQRVRRPPETTLDGLWNRAGSEIAHLSYKRTSVLPEERTWEFDSIAGSIGRAFRLFLGNVDPANLAEGFEQRMRDSWPPYLNFPIAVGFPPSSGALGVATGTLQDVAALKPVQDTDLIP